MSIKTKLETLLSKANAKTAQSDTTLATAIQSLISGYGGGSSSAGIEYEWNDNARKLMASFHGDWTSIPENCFYNNEYLDLSANIPSSVISIEKAAFLGCKKLSLSELPSGLKYIYPAAFSGCANLALDHLPSSLCSINENAFNRCTSLTIAELPSKVIELGANAFFYCSGLKQIVLPSGINYIYSETFGYCTGLTTVTFKGTPEEIAENAFTGCDKLTTIRVPWYEGDVIGAPWGATNATVVYHYTGE